MSCYCAKIENYTVTAVIVCQCSDWAANTYGGTWVCTGERLVGVGWPVVNGEVVRPSRPEVDE